MEKTERLTTFEKNKKDKAWYKEKANSLAHNRTRSGFYNNGVSKIKNMEVNYDLFNNILNVADFEYVCQPWGAKIGELPASMVNRDISSGKIKAMLGMEMKSAFAWNIIATNPEATTRKEQEEFGRLREYVVSEILKPIRTRIETQKIEEAGGQITPEDMERISQEIEEELAAQTPDEVKKYMKRDHQDPAEVMSTHLLNYLIQKIDLKRKFNEIYKHGLLSSVECMYVGILNGEPEAWVVNPKRLDFDDSSDSVFIEDGSWVTCSYRMGLHEIIRYFNRDLKEHEIDIISSSINSSSGFGSEEDLFERASRSEDDSNGTLEVIHCEWISLRKLGFLTYIDENEEVAEKIVDESYEINPDFGDISIEWEWLPEKYETWIIKASEPIYVNMRPVPGQFKDIDNPYYCPLSYKGAVYDNMNSEPTSLMDRLKVYQYYYNIVMYRLELLIASDEGKKVMMNIESIPTSEGFNLEKWQYFFKATPFMWYNNSEEGSQYQDAGSIAKVIDLSLASDIQKYIEIAEYLRTQAGRSVGITDQVEGQIGPNDAVSNTRQNLVQSSHILEMYSDLHNSVKKNILTALLEVAKVAYAHSKPRKLSYFLDDMSIQLFDLDIGLLDNSTLGIFLSNSSKIDEAKETIFQLAHAALQNQTVELTDIIAILRQDSIIEAEETIKVAQDKRRELENAMEERRIESKEREEELKREFIRETWANEKENIVLKEEERRKTEIAKTALVGLSFNPEVDQDRDGVPDFLEIAKHGVDAEIKRSKQKLDEEKFSHQKEMDKRKAKIEEQKVKNQSKNRVNS